jgi:hypothetical protein
MKRALAEDDARFFPKSAKLVDSPPSCKILFVLVDGIADVAIPELNHMSTLQVAHTPHMDLIAGECDRRLALWHSARFAHVWPLPFALRCIIQRGVPTDAWILCNQGLRVAVTLPTYQSLGMTHAICTVAGGRLSAWAQEWTWSPAILRSSLTSRPTMPTPTLW